MHNDDQDFRNWNSFKNGDWDAYKMLYEMYFGLLNNYGYKFTRDTTLIEDSIQDLFIKLWSNRKTLGSPPSVKNYLYKSLRGMLFRKMKSQLRLSELKNEDYDFEVSFDNMIILREEEERLQRIVSDAINKLPARQKEIVFLRFYEGLTYEEIADIMAIDVKSVYKLLYKALNSLQNSMQNLLLHLLILCGFQWFEPQFARSNSLFNNLG